MRSWRLIALARRDLDAAHPAPGIDTRSVHVGDVHRRQGEVARRDGTHDVGDMERADGALDVLVGVPPRTVSAPTEVEGGEETVVAALGDAGVADLGQECERFGLLVG